MLITNKDELIKYHSPNRLWQGIPGIAVTKKGRLFVTFYSGGITEEINNYVVLIKSDDDGKTFSEPIAAAFKNNYRCYDPCLWVDPSGRMWLFWALAPRHAVYASYCENPDADELVWSEEIKVGNDVMMNKPTVLTTGEWLLPIAVWDYDIITRGFDLNKEDNDRKAFAYKSIDNGVTFEKLGGCNIKNRHFDEHMILELNDKRLAMFIRTRYGIGVSYSFDRGRTWTEGVDSLLGGPCSRFFIRRLKSGNVLLINHYNFKGRSHLTALLSDDDCKSWKYSLLIDERSNVSYPDAVETDDGYIYITYDRERGASKHSLDEVYNQAREILVAKITEKDIINGKLTDKGSNLKIIASKLGKYADEKNNPYNEIKRFSNKELADYMKKMSADEITDLLFEQFSINCMNLHRLDNNRLDKLIESLKTESCNKENTINEIILLIRSVNDLSNENVPIVERIKEILHSDYSNEITLEDISDKLGISMYYMCHLFKKTTGLTIIEYKKNLKLTKAKGFLVNTDKSITQIVQECGFGSSSYFSKVFIDSENVTPSKYRELLKK